MASKVLINRVGMTSLQKGLDSGMAEMAHELAAEASPHKPSKSVVTVVVKANRSEVRFSAPALWEEMGTAAHIIDPKKKKALMFGGRFASHVEHPATRPHPFINPALMAIQNRAGGILRRGIARVYK